MNAKQILALGLILAGVLVLAYRGFTYTKETHHADIPIIGDIKVEKKERVNIPNWAGVAAIVAGAGLLVVSRPGVFKTSG